MNLATNSMEKLTKMLINTDAKLKEMGKTPYGQKELTAKEQRDRINALTTGELLGLMNEHGVEAVNDWLNKYGKEDNYA